jgi:hypothetical protein
LRCRTPLLPTTYVTDLGGGAIICDAEGQVLARRPKDEGAGVVVADVEIKRADTTATPPPGFWIQELDPLSKLAWRAQGWHGRRWYRRHAGRLSQA